MRVHKLDKVSQIVTIHYIYIGGIRQIHVNIINNRPTSLHLKYCKTSPFFHLQLFKKEENYSNTWYIFMILKSLRTGFFHKVQ